MPNKEPDTVFLYDAVGNREYLSYAYGKIRYNYGMNNELLYQDINKTGGVRYVYDANGNLIKEDHLRGKDVYKQVNLSWDSENRLKQMQYPFTNKSKMKGKEKIKDSFLEFEYDGDGNRIRKTSLYGTKKKKETVYVRDSSGSVIEEYETRYDLDELPEVVITNIYVAGVYKNQVKWENGIKKTNEEYISKDSLGSTALITDPTGKVVQRYKYSPFGNIDYSKGSSDNNIQFTGKEIDKESGLTYFGARYYNPVIGRWISKDPLVGRMGNPQSLNRYIYCENNPLVKIDIWGYLVTAVYNKKAGTLTVTDDDSGESITVDVESGGKPTGEPIPTSDWEILEHSNEDRYRLDAVDKKPRNDIHEPTGRNELRLHVPGTTTGCIACKTKEGWDKANKMLKETKTSEATVVSKPTWWAKLLGKKEKKEKLKKYGTLKVINDKSDKTGEQKKEKKEEKETLEYKVIIK